MIEIGVKFQGIVDITVTNPDGSVDYQRQYNSETNFLRQALVKWLTGTPNWLLTPPSQIGAGTGTGIPTVQDTALWAPIPNTQKPLDLASISQTYWATFNVTYDANDPNGPYNEFGLFDSSGNLWAHVPTNNLTKSVGQTITVQWSIQMIADTSNPNAIITNYLRSAFAQWMIGTQNIGGSIPYPTKIQLGTGTGTLSSNDTSLWTPATSTLIGCTSDINGYNAVIASTYSDSSSGSYTEIGLLDSANNLWIHGILSATKTSGNYLCPVINVNIASPPNTFTSGVTYETLNTKNESYIALNMGGVTYDQLHSSGF